MAGDIPQSVKDMIAESIDSVTELEALFLLRGHKEREWTASDAGQRLYVSTTVAAHALAVLADRGFFAANNGGYRYAPATPNLEATVSELAGAYSRHLVAVTHLIHSKPAVSVRQFADAFRLRKGK